MICQKLLLYKITDILDYSMINFEKFKLNLGEIKFRDMIDEALETIRLPCSQKKLKLEINID